MLTFFLLTRFSFLNYETKLHDRHVKKKKIFFLSRFIISASKRLTPSVSNMHERLRRPKPLRYCCIVLSSLVSGEEQFGLFSQVRAHLEQRDHIRVSVFDVFDVRLAPEPADVILSRAAAHCCPLVIHVSGFYTLSACLCVPLTLNLA